MHLNHAYPARRLPDGSFEIDGLDIFETCARRNPHTGAVDLFDVGWLQSAAERANAREAAGYLAPVHLGHHGPQGAAPPFAGFLRNQRVELRPVGQPAQAFNNEEAAPEKQPANADLPQPRPAAVLRATLTGIPAEVFARIVERRLPYRSVEIHDPVEPEISSLALLDSVVPFFKFPITNVVLTTQAEEERIPAATEEEEEEVAAEGVGAEATAAVTAQDGNTRFAEHEGRLHALARFQALPWAAEQEQEQQQQQDQQPQLKALLTQAEDAVRQVVNAVGAVPTAATNKHGNEDDDNNNATRTAQINAGLEALAAEGFVFAQDALQRVVAHSTNPPAVFAALRRVLPKAPLAAQASATADDEEEVVEGTAGTNTVERLLHELGRSHDATARRVAREAAAEYAANAERFQSIGCTFSEADYIRAKLVPITFA